MLLSRGSRSISAQTPNRALWNGETRVQAVPNRGGGTPDSRVLGGHLGVYLSHGPQAETRPLGGPADTAVLGLPRFPEGLLRVPPGAGRGFFPAHLRARSGYSGRQ